MNLRTLLAASFVAILLATPGFADLVGKDAPDFKAGEMINEVPQQTLDDCRGEVILIKYWGTR